MKRSRRTFVLLAVLIPMLAQAAEISVQIRSVATTLPKIEQSGFDTMLLPLREPVTPAEPERMPLDAAHPFRGVLTPEQNAVLTRGSEQAFGPLNEESPKNIALPAKIELLNRDGKPVFSFATDLSPDQTLHATIGMQAIKIESGQTLLFSFPGPTPQSAVVYLVSMTKM